MADNERTSTHEPMPPLSLEDIRQAEEHRRGGGGPDDTPLWEIRSGWYHAFWQAQDPEGYRRAMAEEEREIDRRVRIELGVQARLREQEVTEVRPALEGTYLEIIRSLLHALADTDPTALRKKNGDVLIGYSTVKNRGIVGLLVEQKYSKLSAKTLEEHFRKALSQHKPQV